MTQDHLWGETPLAVGPKVQSEACLRVVWGAPHHGDARSWTLGVESECILSKGPTVSGPLSLPAAQASSEAPPQHRTGALGGGRQGRGKALCSLPSRPPPLLGQASLPAVSGSATAGKSDPLEK